MPSLQRNTCPGPPLMCRLLCPGSVSTCTKCQTRGDTPWHLQSIIVIGPQRTRGQVRNFARTLIPRSLNNQMVPRPEHKTIVKDALLSRRAPLTTMVKDICSARRDNPLPDPLPPPVRANPFFTSHGPITTSNRPPVAPRQIYCGHIPHLNPPHSSPSPNHSEG